MCRLPELAVNGEYFFAGFFACPKHVAFFGIVGPLFPTAA
jgi:hypothetical protein